MAAYEVLLLNTAIPQIQAAQSGDTYVVPRDIAFSAALTLSAGTANGVPYLNGSKVLTTGSALTFDGTTFGVSVAGAAVGRFAGGANTYFDVTDGTGNFRIQLLSNNPHIGSSTNNDVIFIRNNTEGMRLTSTGLGIGTSSPGAKLDVSRSTTGAVAQFANASAWGQIIIAAGGSNQNTYLNFSPTGTGKAIFQVGIADLMFLDSSGNLGLGVTPSAWATLRGLQNGRANLVGYANNSEGAWLTNNAFFDGSWKYQTSSQATHYQQLSGVHSWHIAASGTAGNAISFTQAMTLDASGNLLVGGNSAAALDGVRGIVAGGSSQTNGGVAYESSTSQWLTYTDSTQALIFYDSRQNTERARITSGGEFLVGTTTTGVGNAAGVGIGYNSGASYQSIGHANGTSSGAVYISFGYNAGAIGNITQNGTTGVLYNITSDYRLKNVVGAVTGAGARIDALKPVDYTWKTDGSAARGFLAHEFQEIYPNSVIGTKDAVDEEGKPIHQQMQASTSEVIADLVAELQSLRARVAQLEGK